MYSELLVIIKGNRSWFILKILVVNLFHYRSLIIPGYSNVFLDYMCHFTLFLV